MSEKPDVLEGEVLSADEAAARQKRVQQAHQQRQHAETADAAKRAARGTLGALGGELLARFLGADPKVGRRLGVAAAQVLGDSRTQQALRAAGEKLTAAVKRKKG